MTTTDPTAADVLALLALAERQRRALKWASELEARRLYGCAAIITNRAKAAS